MTATRAAARRLAGLAVAAIALLASPALAAELRVLTTGAFKSTALALVPSYEAATGDTVALENDTAGGVARRIRDGAAFDLVVLTPAALDALAAEGRVVPGSRVDLARVGVGVAVKAGAPRPDLASVEDFRRALLAARSIAYIDPRAGGSSGIYVAELLQRLGLAEQVAAKAVLAPGGYVAERVASGQAELGIYQISEILPVPGVELAGPLPDAIQNYTTYSAGLGANAARPDAARALLRLLAGPEAAALMRAKGMLPAASAAGAP